MGSCRASSCKNREELKTRILQGQANLGKRRNILRNLCDSMPRHVAALLETEEGSNNRDGINNNWPFSGPNIGSPFRLVIRKYLM